MGVTVQRRPDRKVVRKLVAGVRTVFRAIAAACCCGSEPAAFYKVRRCSDGLWAGWCHSTPPPYYFYCEGNFGFPLGGGASCGCMFTAEAIGEDEVCDTAPPHEETVLDSCADCDETTPPDPPPPDPEPDPSPCPCDDEFCEPFPNCIGTGGIANTWKIYIDGWVRHECFAHGVTFEWGETGGDVNGVYSINCPPPHDLETGPLTYTTYFNELDLHCESTFRSQFTLNGTVLVDEIGLVITTGGYAWGHWTTVGDFKCCRANIMEAVPFSYALMGTGGSVVLVPCI